MVSAWPRPPTGVSAMCPMPHSGLGPRVLALLWDVGKVGEMQAAGPHRRRLKQVPCAPSENFARRMLGDTRVTDTPRTGWDPSAGSPVSALILEAGTGKQRAGVPTTPGGCGNVQTPRLVTIKTPQRPFQLPRSRPGLPSALLTHLR